MARPAFGERASSASTHGLYVQIARGLAGVAGAMLRWDADHFWSATPDEFFGVIEALLPSEASADRCDGDALAQLKDRFPDG